jgi:hypothetical protein
LISRNDSNCALFGKVVWLRGTGRPLVVNPDYDEAIIMVGEDLQPVSDQLAERSIIRAEAVSAWVSLALEQPNPTEWANALVAAALEKLNTVPHSLKVKAEAKLQLHEIRSAIHAGIVEALTERRYHRPVGKIESLAQARWQTSR